MTAARLVLAVAGLALVGACAPTVKIEPPDKPIVINLNIKIEQEVRIKIEKDLDALLSQEEELF
ncbi:MAG: YnbE family lipoprotein [Alphaproteobacteria bacterium]